MSFILVDCNNFYASCERLFNPHYEGKPVIVLSNNDGCVVARSQESKQLGIKMGEPFFKIKNLCKQYDVIVCSSNYELYGDLSDRIMSILSKLGLDIQVYSIDEAFLKFPKEEGSIFNQCFEIKKMIKKWVGIPISIGIAPTKTLAKIAGASAKKGNVGVVDLSDFRVKIETLKMTPVGDIWGVGGNSQSKLHVLGIYTAWDLHESDPLLIKKKMGITGERIVWELRGISCLPLEELESKKSITSSRSFGKPMLAMNDLAEALSNYINSACIKLRAQKSCVQAMSVWIESVLNAQTGERRYHQSMVAFPFPTNDTAQMISEAKRCLLGLFREGLIYKKCGVTLIDLIQESNVIPDFLVGSMDPKRKHLMKTVDALNTQFGKNKLFYGAMGINREWTMKRENSSPCFTTNWNDLAIAKA